MNMTPDGSQPVTRYELNGALNAMEARMTKTLALEIIKTHGRIDALASQLNSRMDSEFGWIRATIDGFLSTIETFQRESVGLPNTLDQHGKVLKDHEGRIAKLEAPQG